MRRMAYFVNNGMALRLYLQNLLFLQNYICLVRT